MQIVGYMHNVAITFVSKNSITLPYHLPLCLCLMLLSIQFTQEETANMINIVCIIYISQVNYTFSDNSNLLCLDMSCMTALGDQISHLDQTCIHKHAQQKTGITLEKKKRGQKHFFSRCNLSSPPSECTIIFRLS